MILICPLCHTRYLVQANMFAAGARQVRCAKCKHAWKAELPREIEAVGAPPPEPDAIPDAVTPIPDGSNLPVVTRNPLSKSARQGITIGLSLLFLLVLAWLIFDRQSIARRWTSLEPYYNAVGLNIYYPGDGLEFDQVRSELVYDGGGTKLVLNGKIRNKTPNNQKVPDIIAEARGADGQIIKSWQIPSPQATLAPGEDAAFSSSINTPEGTVVNINLNFVEIKDDD